MLKVIIILIVVVMCLILYSGVKLAKSADQWEEDWWDEHRDSGLYTDDE